MCLFIFQLTLTHNETAYILLRKNTLKSIKIETRTDGQLRKRGKFAKVSYNLVAYKYLLAA